MALVVAIMSWLVPLEFADATTGKLGSLQVTKTVDWNGAAPDEDQTFALCITGPSFPNQPNCKTVGFDGGTLTWTNLIPGNYSAGEKNPGATWIVTSSQAGDVTVPTDGGQAEVVPEVTNTFRLPAEALGEQLAMTGAESGTPLAFVSVVLVLVARRRRRRRQ